MKAKIKVVSLIVLSPVIAFAAVVGFAVATVVFGATRFIAGGKIYE
jgi:hypothetical protein